MGAGGRPRDETTWRKGLGSAPKKEISQGIHKWLTGTPSVGDRKSRMGRQEAAKATRKKEHKSAHFITEKSALGLCLLHVYTALG